MAFSIRGIQGQGETFTVPLSGGTWQGTETFSATISTGTGEAAMLTLTPVFTSGQTFPNSAATVDIAFTAANFSALAPGGYIGVIGTTGGSAAVAWFALRVLPGAIGATILRTLCTPGQAMLLQPDLINTQDDIDGLAPVLVAATRALETYCRRPLALTTFDRYYRPGRKRKIYLHGWPVAPGIKLTCDLVTALTITMQSGTATNADVSTSVASSTSLTPTTLTLNWQDNAGGSFTQPFTLATYSSIGALATAINAFGSNWLATVIGNSYNGQPLSQWPTSQLLHDPGYHGALGQSAEVFVYGRELTRFSLDTYKGTVELTENRPEEYRYADRAYGIGFGWSWSAAAEPKHANIRGQYQAGYAIAAADIAAGLEPVPEDLTLCTVATAQAMLRGLPMIGPTEEQAVKDRSYKLKSDDLTSFIPKPIRAILDSKYVNRRIF